MPRSMIWEQNEGSELVVVLTMVQVEVATEVMDVIEVVADKQMHKARDEFTRGTCNAVRTHFTSQLNFLQPPYLTITLHKTSCCHHPVSHLPPHTLPSLLNFRSLHKSQSLSTNQFAAVTLQSLLKLSFCILCSSPIPALKTLLCKACIAIDVGLMWGNRGTGGDFPMFVYLILLFVNDLSINV